jgi:hypothetical protein
VTDSAIDERGTSLTGLIILEATCAGAHRAGHPPAACEVAGAGHVAMVARCIPRAIDRVGLETLHLPCARQLSTLPGWLVVCGEGRSVIVIEESSGAATGGCPSETDLFLQNGMMPAHGHPCGFVTGVVEGSGGGDHGTAAARPAHAARGAEGAERGEAHVSGESAPVGHRPCPPGAAGLVVVRRW